MRPALRARALPAVAAIAARFGLDDGSLVELEGFENLVYESPGRRLVLRVGHGEHRTADQVAAELDWVARLAAAGCPVAPPVPARDGSAVVTVPDRDGEDVVGVAFARAPGVILDDDPAAKARWWNAALFRRWGAAVAALHHHSGVATIRPHWHQIDEISRLDRLLAAAPADARAAASAHVARLRDEGPGPHYGLVHGDATQWNFVVGDDGALTLFDFDSAMRCWLAMDVAVALYYARHSDPGGGGAEFTAEFLGAFAGGYRSVRPLPDAELARLPDLLLLQTVILYGLVHRDGDRAEASDFRLRARRRLVGAEEVVPGLAAAVDGLRRQPGA